MRCRGELPPGDSRGAGVSSRRGTAGRQATRRLRVAVSRFPRASGQPRPAPCRDREEASRRAPRGRDDRHCDPVRLTLPRSPATGLSTIQLAPECVGAFSAQRAPTRDAARCGSAGREHRGSSVRSRSRPPSQDPRFSSNLGAQQVWEPSQLGHSLETMPWVFLK